MRDNDFDTNTILKWIAIIVCLIISGALYYTGNDNGEIFLVIAGIIVLFGD
jgi:hypothetical protein